MKTVHASHTASGIDLFIAFTCYYCGYTTRYIDIKKGKISPFYIGYSRHFTNNTQYCIARFYDSFFGIGAIPAIVALLIYALLPIIRNTYTGITGVSVNVMEAGKAMGMNSRQLLFKVQFPLAMPVILAGIRTATVINVGVATLASFVGAGGLGEFIFGGISLNNSNMILAGAIPAAFLAIFWIRLSLFYKV